MEQGKLWRQYLYAGVANFAIASVGCCMGWSATMFPRLLDGETPLRPPPSPRAVGSLASIILLGMAIGPTFGGILSAKLGRKWGLLASIFPLLVGWVLIIIGTHIYMLYVGRFFWGMANGMLYTTVPPFCTEIATDSCRGALGSFLPVFFNLGYLLMKVVRMTMSYRVGAVVGLAGVVFTGILLFFIAETPTYKLLKGDREQAAESLMKIRGRSRAEVETELSLMSADVNAALEKKASFLDVFKGSNCKAFYISCGLVIAQHLSGNTIAMFYMVPLLMHSGTMLSVTSFSFLSIGVQIAASLITLVTVDRHGRSVLLIISTVGAAIGWAILGTNYPLELEGSRLIDGAEYVPMVGMVMFFVSYSLGLGSLPLVIMSELVPVEVRMTASSIVNTLHAILTALIPMFFRSLFMSVNINLLSFAFCVCCMLSFFFVIFAVPETKRKSYREIQEMLARRKGTQGNIDLVDIQKTN